ncbi:hypothetical protein [Pseudomonas sp. LP_7_YM]|uniref:hypothetical protein n=1 Tax=Pseudomonas sp. LP_7_YM TaxID=2485137 RepID=UPI00105F53CF|nr:hypothetical protein [Pseudomonas sp. LP_7_YM]TDV59405.1 hypothetical protein EC915_11712 [Pseudomonas sp. LP_7_YM]
MSQPFSFVNERMQTYQAIKASLPLGRRLAEKFDVVNAHIRNNVVVAGELVIIGDDSTAACTAEEAELMRLAAVTHQTLVDNDAGGDDFIVANHEFLTRLISTTSIGVDMALDGWEKHLENVKKTLESIDVLHKQYLTSGTVIERNLFYTKRRQLFDQLDKLLKGFLKFGTGLRNTGSIKQMLGISTKSYLHTGEIRNYAEKLAGVARASKLIKRGAYVGIVLDTASTAIDIKTACSTGREDECTKAKYVEGGKLVGSLSGAAFLGSLSTVAATLLCVTVLGLTTGPGALACGVITGATMGWAGGEAGSYAGENIGDYLYETIE